MANTNNADTSYPAGPAPFHGDFRWLVWAEDEATWEARAPEATATLRAVFAGSPESVRVYSNPKKLVCFGELRVEAGELHIRMTEDWGSPVEFAEELLPNASPEELDAAVERVLSWADGHGMEVPSMNELYVWNSWKCPLPTTFGELIKKLAVVEHEFDELGQELEEELRSCVKAERD
jgi:hypothetical protein